MSIMLINLEDFLNRFTFKLNGIVHIGACMCEERPIYNKIGVDDLKTVWIDANPKIVEQVVSKYPTVQIYNYAITDTSGEDIVLNVTNNDQSSSILELGTHKEYYPNIVVSEKVTSKTVRLDDFLNNNPDVTSFTNGGVNLLNLDIQGVELMAMKSLGNLINRFKIIYTEVNIEELYKGCCLLEDIDKYLESYGYKRVKLYMTEYKWGDAIYLHKSLLPNEIKVAVNIMGGLGNQLFQIATLLSYCDQYGYKPIFDPTHVSDLRSDFILYREDEFFKNIVSEEKLENYTVYREDESKFNPIPRSYSNTLLIGYFNSEKYFEFSKNKIKKIFQNYFLPLVHKLGVEPFEGVGIHVRRGDYLKYSQQFHLLTNNYYQKALYGFQKGNKIAVVSDDIEWCKKSIEADLYISKDSFSDFLFLMNCQNGLIIANSTFSWWAAYLNPNNPHIVYPFEWFKPEYLIRFQRYYVKGWQAVSEKSANQIINLIISNLDKDRQYSFDISTCLLSNRYEPIGFSKEESIKFLDNYLISSWYLNRKDISEKCGAKIVEILKDKLLRLVDSTVLNLTFALPNNFSYKIDLTTVPIYLICRYARRATMEERFSVYGLKPIFIDAVPNTNSVVGCAKAHRNALKIAIKNGVYPFAIFEDDIKFTSTFQIEFSIPKITDAFYLGQSRAALKENGFTDNYNGIETSKIGNFYRVNNMLGGHGILFVKPKLAYKCYKTLKGILKLGIPCDVVYAMYQKKCNCFTFRTPMVVQDSTLNGQEICTTVSMDEYL